jgi:hypothetical protein
LKIMRFCNFISWLLFFVVEICVCFIRMTWLVCRECVINGAHRQTEGERERNRLRPRTLTAHDFAWLCVCALFLSLSLSLSLLPVLCCAFRECRRVKVCHHASCNNNKTTAI